MRVVPREKSLPEIRIEVGQVDRMTDEAIEKALTKDTALFQREGELVHVVEHVSKPNPKPKEIMRSHGTPVIKAVKSATVLERLCKHARWLRAAKSGDHWNIANPPKDVVSAVCARGQWPGVRPIVGVTTSPMARRDGTILQKAGYDPESGMVYRPNAQYPGVPDAPTYADAMRARDSVLEIVRTKKDGFAFAGEQHRSAWLAAFMSILMRGAIDGAMPMFAVDATTQGTGKTKLIKATALAALGIDIAAFPMPRDEDEFRKRVTSILYAGDRCVMIDNVRRPLGGETIEALCTSTTWGDRALGSLQLVKVPNLALWFATGNNIQAAGDMGRRLVRIRLETEHENPDQRTDFYHKDLLSWVARERHMLVTQALTIVRAWFVSLCPGRDNAKLWGGFEEWSSVVPPMIRWIGMTDPLLARVSHEDYLDIDKMHLIQLHVAWTKLDSKGEGMLVREFLEKLFPEHKGPPDGLDDAREAVEEITRTSGNGRESSIRLSKFIVHRLGNTVRGRKFERAEIDGTKTNRWVVRNAANAPVEMPRVVPPPLPAPEAPRVDETGQRSIDDWDGWPKD